MSDKIKSKDLSYDSSLPPFLQRLRAQNAGNGDSDRHEREIARPRKAKDPNDDDGPTVVDESGETLTRDEYEKLTAVQDTENVKGGLDPFAEPQASGALPDRQGEALKQEAKKLEVKVTDGTALKKRKVAKIVGNENNEDAKDDSKAANPIKRAKRKAKPVQLAFNDDEEEAT